MKLVHISTNHPQCHPLFKKSKYFLKVKKDGLTSTIWERRVDAVDPEWTFYHDLAINCLFEPPGSIFSEIANSVPSKLGEIPGSKSSIVERI